MFAKVKYKNSSGFTLINFSIKYWSFLYLLTLILAIKPLLFFYTLLPNVCVIIIKIIGVKFIVTS